MAAPGQMGGFPDFNLNGKEPEQAGNKEEQKKVYSSFEEVPDHEIKFLKYKLAQYYKAAAFQGDLFKTLEKDAEAEAEVLNEEYKDLGKIAHVEPAMHGYKVVVKFPYEVEFEDIKPFIEENNNGLEEKITEEPGMAA